MGKKTVTFDALPVKMGSRGDMVLLNFGNRYVSYSTKRKIFICAEDGNGKPSIETDNLNEVYRFFTGEVNQ